MTAPLSTRWRKKPVVIEAIRYEGNRDEIEAFIGQQLVRMRGTDVLLIPTLESPHEAAPGDWIIKGVKGEFYPCKPDIFEQTYERVNDPNKLGALDDHV